MTPGPLHAELLGRAAAFEAEVSATVDDWHRERRERWDAVRGRVEALTMQMAAAERDCRRNVSIAAAGPRGRAGAALRWLFGFDRERQHLEDEIWAHLRAARVEDERWRAAVGRKLDHFSELGRRLARETESVLDEAAASSRARAADTPAARALVRELTHASQELAQRLSAFGAEVQQGLATLGARGFTDGASLGPRFEELMAARLGGGAAPVARAVRRAAAPARKPDRKKARVPKFVLSKFYRPGTLRTDGDGVQITFVNPLAFCIVQGGDAVMVDGRPFPREETVLDNGERQVGGAELSDAAYLKFPKGGEIRVTLRGLELPPGQHRFLCSLELRKMGWVELDVQDRV